MNGNSIEVSEPKLVYVQGSKAIISFGGITINGGVFEIDSADDAVHSNGKITVNVGYLVLSSGDDAIHAEGSVEINGATSALQDRSRV